MLVGVGSGMAVEAASVPVPHLLKSFRKQFAFLKLAIQVCGSGSAGDPERNIGTQDGSGCG